MIKSPRLQKILELLFENTEIITGEFLCNNLGVSSRTVRSDIKELNKKLLLSIDDNYPISLTQGLMGVCIYFYHLYRIDNNEEYKLIADDLLDDILGKLSFESPISVENGLAGIGLGIMHLIE